MESCSSSRLFWLVSRLIMGANGPLTGVNWLRNHQKMGVKIVVRKGVAAKGWSVAERILSTICAAIVQKRAAKWPLVDQPKSKLISLCDGIDHTEGNHGDRG